MIVGVFGVRGGGTSAIAGVVHLLGFPFFGEPKTLDDTELYKDLNVAKTRTGDWMFKHPFLTSKVHAISKQIPNLKIIYVFRDPVATALHSAGDYKMAVRDDHALQRTMLTGPEGLYISYERAIRYPEETVEQIAKYLDRPVNSHAILWLSEPEKKYRNISDYAS